MEFLGCRGLVQLRSACHCQGGGASPGREVCVLGFSCEERHASCLLCWQLRGVVRWPAVAHVVLCTMCPNGLAAALRVLGGPPLGCYPGCHPCFWYV